MTKTQTPRKVKRWAVRENLQSDGTAWYGLFVGLKPRKDWNSKRAKFVVFLCSRHFEAFVPKCYHLPPGGGPVEIRFEDE